ncbi:M20/M25/M40 family metallo-hydrolase [bacterium]|nr:M20/M25/M40 family metallo-hydrolase [candidate division CSSED10-310 bacterium]
MSWFEQNTRVVSLVEALSDPAVPFHEEFVARAVARETARLRQVGPVSLRRDAVGNLFLSYQPLPVGAQTMVMAAHMDHPGFEVVSFTSSTVEMRVLGGLPEQFCQDTGVLLVNEHGDRTPATITRKIQDKLWEAVAATRIESAPLFAVWDVPSFELDDHVVWGLAMDDLAGCALQIAALEEIMRRGVNVNVTAVFHRAEEVGFLGAAAVALGGVLPADALIISLEASKALPGAEVNQGPVIRLGDKMYIFDPNAAGYLEQAGELLREEGMHIQKRIMDGGTCEASLYHAAGYSATGLAVPLLNYHNTAPDRVDKEGVGIYDLNVGARLLVETAELFAIETRPRRMEFVRRVESRLQNAAGKFISYTASELLQLSDIKE